MPDSADLCCLLIYIAVFLYGTFKAGLFQWLWGSVLLWLASGILMSTVLPGMAGITHATAFYIPQFYIAVASVFFFVHQWRRMPAKNMWETGTGVFVSLFAVSGVLMHFAFFCLLGLVLLNYPGGISAYILPALLQMYVFEPLYWIGMQILIMLLFYIHRVLLEKHKGSFFSLGQLQGGFLLALVYQIVWVATLMQSIRH